MKNVIFKIMGLGLMFLVYSAIRAQDSCRWELSNNKGITWNINKNIPHSDHIEMSGEQLSVVLRYGVDNKQSFVLNRSIVWPMLRFQPNETHDHLNKRFALDIKDLILINNCLLEPEQVDHISLNGLMIIESKMEIKFLLT